jgi:sugar/nucleoside kinase (ribokinase family)
MLPHLSEIWEALLSELCPVLTGPRRKMFFDLSDPEKRTREDLRHALDLILRFENYFDVTLGLNAKEAVQVAVVLGLDAPPNETSAGLQTLAAEIRRRLPINTLVIHPVNCAVSASNQGVSLVEGPFVAQPKTTTGAGDHFNAGFCLGQLLGFDHELCLLLGVATSGHYVRTAVSPDVDDLLKMLKQEWPGN